MKKLISYIKNLAQMTNQAYTPVFRVIEIIMINEIEYKVKIQVINKNVFFEIKPEEILAKDKFVDQFSPRDIRILTYLGYLGINSPKYTILAKRLSAGHDSTVFALKKKGDKQILVKTANQISNEKEIINNLNPSDAHTIGFTTATENILLESKQKASAKQLHNI